jgi:hypothetical protein
MDTHHYMVSPQKTVNLRLLVYVITPSEMHMGTCTLVADQTSMLSATLVLPALEVLTQ